MKLFLIWISVSAKFGGWERLGSLVYGKMAMQALASLLYFT
jgi:hypothetical protein